MREPLDGFENSNGIRLEVQDSEAAVVIKGRANVVPIRGMRGLGSALLRQIVGKHPDAGRSDGMRGIIIEAMD